MVSLGNSWDTLLKNSFESEWYQALRNFLIEEYNTQTIYPDMYDIFNALRSTSYEDVKVVVIGQDPYHGNGQAHGFCFSVQKGVRVPPSLLNIYKELNSDIGIPISKDGCLVRWAEQGVLLLNAILTVRAASPLSHKGRGWEKLTDRVITLLNERETPVVFMLWGGPARSKKNLVTNPRHLILEAPHPSPLSAHSGFLGCKHFSKTNDFLISNNIDIIDWNT